MKFLQGLAIIIFVVNGFIRSDSLVEAAKGGGRGGSNGSKGHSKTSQTSVGGGSGGEFGLPGWAIGLIFIGSLYVLAFLVFLVRYLCCSMEDRRPVPTTEV